MSLEAREIKLLGGIFRDFAGISRRCPKSLRTKQLCSRGSTGVERCGCIPQSAANNLGEIPQKMGAPIPLFLKSFSGERTLWDSSLLVTLTLWDTLVLFAHPLPLSQNCVQFLSPYKKWDNCFGFLSRVQVCVGCSRLWGGLGGRPSGLLGASLPNRPPKAIGVSLGPLHPF